MPRASLRSVLLICAFSTACMCRVSARLHAAALGFLLVLSARPPAKPRAQFGVALGGRYPRENIFSRPRRRSYRAPGIARLSEFLQASSRSAAADRRQDSWRPSPGSTRAHSLLSCDLHLLSTALSLVSAERQ